MREEMDSNKSVFPARAGMSRGNEMDKLLMGRFPRPRGDEPCVESAQLGSLKFSPPARG